MLADALSWYFVTFGQGFCQGKKEAFELVMFLSLCTCLGCMIRNSLRILWVFLISVCTVS